MNIEKHIRHIGEPNPPPGSIQNQLSSSQCNADPSIAKSCSKKLFELSGDNIICHHVKDHNY